MAGVSFSKRNFLPFSFYGGFMSKQAGKGSKYRPVDPKKWSDNWDKIFGKKKPKKKPKKP
jgi:hypothetical protein